MLFAVRKSRTLPLPPTSPYLDFYLPPYVRSLLTRARRDFERMFPLPPPSKRPVGRPRLPRKPFFLVWLWDRLFLRKPTNILLDLLAEHPTLQRFFEVPPTGLNQTTYEPFVKAELADYLEPLIARNVGGIAG